MNITDLRKAIKGFDGDWEIALWDGEREYRLEKINPLLDRFSFLTKVGQLTLSVRLVPKSNEDSA
jgi:hypothetical protein